MSSNNSLTFRFIFEKEKLKGQNFLEWYRNLRIVLRAEKKDYVLENPVPAPLAANASAATETSGINIRMMRTRLIV